MGKWEWVQAVAYRTVTSSIGLSAPPEMRGDGSTWYSLLYELRNCTAAAGGSMRCGQSSQTASRLT